MVYLYYSGGWLVGLVGASIRKRHHVHQLMGYESGTGSSARDGSTIVKMTHQSLTNAISRDHSIHGVQNPALKSIGAPKKPLIM